MKGIWIAIWMLWGLGLFAEIEGKPVRIWMDRGKTWGYHGMLQSEDRGNLELMIYERGITRTLMIGPEYWVSMESAEKPLWCDYFYVLGSENLINDYKILRDIGLKYLDSGMPEAGIDLMNRAMRLKPSWQKPEWDMIVAMAKEGLYWNGEKWDKVPNMVVRKPDKEDKQISSRERATESVKRCDRVQDNFDDYYRAWVEEPDNPELKKYGKRYWKEYEVSKKELALAEKNKWKYPIELRREIRKRDEEFKRIDYWKEGMAGQVKTPVQRIRTEVIQCGVLKERQRYGFAYR